MHLLMGNHDAWFAFGLPDESGTWMPPDEREHQQWVHSQLNPELRQIVAAWPYASTLRIEGLRLDFLHYPLDDGGTFRSPQDLSPESASALFQLPTSTLVFFGHDHRLWNVTGGSTHFMNPAQLKPLVEMIRGFHTSAETIKITQELLEAIGKDSIVVEDSPGFVTNRVLMLTINEAICLLDEGVATASDVDRLFMRCFGHSMGPLATADLIGLDTILYSLEVLLDSFNDPKYRPSILLRRYVDAGLLGRKSGRGFFSYDATARGE